MPLPLPHFADRHTFFANGQSFADSVWGPPLDTSLLGIFWLSIILIQFIITGIFFGPYIIYLSYPKKWVERIQAVTTDLNIRVTAEIVLTNGWEALKIHKKFLSW